MTKCKVESCKHSKSRREFMCGTCWDKLPKDLKADIRLGTEKGSHSLRAMPQRSWIERAINYVGHIKVAYVVGSGHSAVRLAADRSEA